MQKVTPGDWQTDEHGKRFRRVGNIIEHEMMVQTSGISVPASELEDFHRRNKEAEEKRRKAEQAAAAAEAKKPVRFCPLTFLYAGYDKQCRGDCALYGDNGCKLVKKTATHDTAGLRCPLSASGTKCNAMCEFYKGGCTMAAATEGK